MARWFKIKQPDWHCEARVSPFCGNLAVWEEDRTREQISKRVLAALRCEQHLPSDAIKVDENEAEPEKEAM